MQTVRIDGVDLELTRIPSAKASVAGAPIVILHEGLGSVAMWRDWPAQLCAATGRAGLVYSRQGYGQSEGLHDVRDTQRLAPDYMHREALDVLPRLLNALGISKPVLLGHSDGGSIALIHASAHPVSACVVMAPHVMVEEVSLRAIEQAREAFTAGDLCQRLSRFHADVEGAFWQWNNVWLSGAFRSFDIRHLCRQITAPILAIQGTGDPYGTLRQIDEVAPTAGHFETSVLHSCGHSPHRDQPEATTARIAQFLATLE